MNSEPFTMTFEGGSDHMPSYIRVVFNDRHWNFAMRHSRFDPRYQFDDIKKIEARDAIRSFCYRLEKEMLKCLPEELK